MRWKTLFVALLFAITISLNMFVFVQAQPSAQKRGDLPLGLYGTSRGKPSKPGKPLKGIATGNVSEPPPASDRWAVIIGISDYAGDEYDLEFCDDDALDFYNALINVYGWSSSHINLLIDGQAKKTNILGAIDWMRTNEGSGDEVVFFYSGHGSGSLRNADNDPERKDECIIPWEIESGYYIWDGDLSEEFSDFESARIFFYFDVATQVV